MSDTSTPNNSNDDPPRPRLSLRGKDTPPLGDPPQKAQESKQTLPPSPSAGSGKLKLGLKKSGDTPESVRADASPLPPPSPLPLSAPTPSDQTAPAPSTPLKVKPTLGLRRPDSDQKTESASPLLDSAPPREVPKPLPSDVRPSPSDAPSQDLSEKDDLGLPFSLPERIGDEPPPLPTFSTLAGDAKKPPASVAKPKTKVTFDDLEPAHSRKAPPPVDAPVFKGTVNKRRHSKLGKIIVPLLLVGVIGVVGIYAFALLQEPPAPEPLERTAVLPLAGMEPAIGPDSTALPVETSPDITPPPPPPPDPLIAILVDELEIAVTRPNARTPLIVLGGVAYTPGGIVNPEVGLRFVGFNIENNLREIIFEDARGARYLRPF